jgi:xanthine dehydrogenase accessory factor
MIPRLVMIRGAGDLATGVAYRLWYAGFKVVMLELEQPLVVRRTVSFASAVFDQKITVEGLKAELCSAAEDVSGCFARNSVPVLIDPQARALDSLNLKIIIDATMMKGNLITKITDAELVIGLGPGFTAGQDVHALVETKRGHDLGRVIYSGAAATDTGEPGLVGGYGRERLLRAPVEGIFKPAKEIGALIEKGELAATVDQTPIRAEISGLVRGMLYPGLKVSRGVKVGDIDPRGTEVDYLKISDKARSIGGGVLEAILNRYFFPSPLRGERRGGVERGANNG